MAAYCRVYVVIHFTSPVLGCQFICTFMHPRVVDAFLPGFPSISSFLFVFVPCLACLVRLSSLNVAPCRIVEGWFKAFCLQCFDAVGWAAGRASGL